MVGLYSKEKAYICNLRSFFSSSILFVAVYITGDLYALSPSNVVVSPARTNQYGQYTITATPGNGAVELIANVDSIIIQFNDSTVVPVSINPAHITVNNTASNAVSVYPTSPRRIAILTPVFIDKGNQGGTITIVIAKAANIQNPAFAGTNYRIRMETTKERGLVISNAYSISASNTTISQPAVTPNPSVENLPAAYTVAFNVDSAGALLQAQSTITIVFPSLTFIPDGGLNGVMVNGVTASATAHNDTVVITTPVSVGNNSAVSVYFSSGSGIVNPPAGYYTLFAKTSSENTFVVSANYVISSSTSLSVTAVTITPNNVNAQAQYNLDFVTSSTGAMAAHQDTITFIFPQNTFLPAVITNSSITVTSGGYSDIASAINVIKANSTDDDTLNVVTPIPIGNSATVSMNISTSSGVLNPSILGNYYLSLRTSKDQNTVSSSAYAITNATTQVSQGIVTPNIRTASQRSPYRVQFSLGNQGRLKPGESTITLTFASGYTLSNNPAEYDSCYISINDGGSYTQIPTSLIAPNNTAKTLQFTIPSSVVTTNNNNIILLINRVGTTDPITNPVAGNYNLGIQTSVEPTMVNSATYNIGGTAITINSITLSNNRVNNLSTYTFNITIVNQLRGSGGNNDNITVIFPEGTELPASIATSNITVNGAAAKNVSVNLSNRSVNVTVSTNIGAGSTFNVIIGSTTAVIGNPVVPSTTFYRVTMYTNEDPVPITSSAYTITGNNTNLTGVTATATPSIINFQPVSYTITCTTTSNGKLAGGTAAGSSYTDIAFGSRTRVPSSIPASSVKVNNNACQTVSVLASGDSGKVRVFIPNGLTIDNNSTLSVVFDTSARLENRNPAGTSSIVVKTSSDTANATGSYTLTAAQPLAVTSVTATPSNINRNASYSIRFTTGSSGALNQGDTLRIAIPFNTYVPPAINKNDVTINGINPLVNPAVIGDTVLLKIPQAAGIGNLTNVTVLFNTTAGLLNPTLTGSYTLRLRTQSEPAYVTSPSYAIIAGTSSISTPSVTVSDPRTSVTSPYRISFTTGANGRLLAGTSTMTITFNTSTTVNGTATNYDSVYITTGGTSVFVPTSNISISGQSITMTVPSGVNIGNNSSVTVDINRVGAADPITNPATAGNYTLTVRTSAEPINVTSTAYSISNVPAVTNIRVRLFPDTVNAPSNDTIRFTVSATSGALTAGSGTITITFPNNTFIPATIPVTSVRVASQTNNTFTNATAVTTNSLARTITITTPVAVSNGDSVRIAVLASANVQNPSIYGNYTLQVRTSAQPVNGTSAAYTIVPTTTTVSNVNLIITPYYPNLIGRYEWSFQTGSRGRLLSGTSTVIMILPYDATFTQGVPATSKVTINSVSTAALQLREGIGTNPDTLIATVPSSVTIGNLTNVSVVIDSSAGLRNVSSTDPLSYQIYTSVEPYPVGYDVTLPVVLAFFRASQEAGRVTLNWRTESEVENAFWLIQKTEADENEEDYSSLSYTTVGTVMGQGTTTLPTDYFWADNEVRVGNTYIYRIIDVAYNGAMTIHNPQKIKITPPVNFVLYQNYPNPFNPTTTIRYQLPADAKVEITIYNILGQKVIELLNQIQPQGFYSVNWNGCNDRNYTVAAGVYFYRMSAKPLNGGKSWAATKKMLLLK